IRLEHIFDRSNSGDRLFSKYTEPISQRSDQLAVYVNRAAAHPGNDTCELGLLAAQPDQDQVFVRSDRVLHYGEHFALELLDLCSLKDSVNDSDLAGLDLRQWHCRGAAAART